MYFCHWFSFTSIYNAGFAYILDNMKIETLAEKNIRFEGENFKTKLPMSITISILFNKNILHYNTLLRCLETFTFKAVSL